MAPDQKQIREALSALELIGSSNLTEESIQNQYRKLSKLYHPDVSSEEHKDGTKFREISHARDTLLQNLDSVNAFLIRQTNGRSNPTENKDTIRELEKELSEIEAELAHLKKRPEEIAPFLSRMHWLHLRILSSVKDEKAQNQLRLKLYYLVHQLADYYYKRLSDYDHASEITEALYREFYDLSGANAALQKDREKIRTAQNRQIKKERKLLKPLLILAAFSLLLPAGKGASGETIGQKLFYTFITGDWESHAFPENGHLFKAADAVACTQLTVDCSGTDAVYVKLKNKAGETVVAFFVRPGETATVDVPREELEFYYAQDVAHTRKWLGEEKCFGLRTYYAKDDEIMDFTQHSHSVQFFTMNGNMHVSRVKADAF